MHLNILERLRGALAPLLTLSPSHLKERGAGGEVNYDKLSLSLPFLVPDRY
jgi:hypothetical protein